MTDDFDPAEVPEYFQDWDREELQRALALSGILIAHLRDFLGLDMDRAGNFLNSIYTLALLSERILPDTEAVAELCCRLGLTAAQQAGAQAVMTATLLGAFMQRAREKRQKKGGGGA